jgi:alcohol dehydrogenase class IV
MPSYFKIPKTIVYGRGSIEELKKLRSKRVAVFTDRASMEKLGFLQRTKEFLREGGAEEVQVSPDISREPGFGDVSKCIEWARMLAPDHVVALGGGSVMDVAKTVRVLLNRPGFDIVNLNRVFEFPKTANNVKGLTVIPSTSGTGSEITRLTVLVNPRTGLKELLISEELTADIAIIDPDLPTMMPPGVTANTGFDALSHAMESYVCTNSNDFSEPLALKSIKLIFDNLERCYKNGKDMEAREKVHYASTIAGMAMANSGAGLVHRMDQVGPQFNLPHGLVMAILLPYVMRYNSKECADKYAEIAKVLGISEPTKELMSESLARKTEELRSYLNMPPNLEKAGIGEADLVKNVEAASIDAIAGQATRFHPRKATLEEVKRLFWCSFRGDEVAF